MPSEKNESSWALCGACGQGLLANRGPSRDQHRSEAMAPSAPPPARWHLAVGEVVQGPFTREQVLALRARGACDASALVHRSGWDEWRSLESVAFQLGGDLARGPAPLSGSQQSSAERVRGIAHLRIAAMRGALHAAISRTRGGFQSRWAKVAARVQLTVIAGLDRVSFAFEHAGERLRTRAEGLHPEVLLGFAVLGFMTVVGNVIGLVLLAVTAPLAAEAQAGLPDGAASSSIAIPPLPAPAADPLLGRHGQPGLPSRDQVLEALSGPQVAIATCRGRGTARVSLNVRGLTGRVSAMTVEGVTPISRACVQRALRKTVFPKFRQANLRVRVPFKLEQS
jgi:hypothetical protein